MSPKQVFVIWTHPLFQKSLTLILDHPEIELIGETSNYKSAPQEIERLRPDTLLIEEIDKDDIEDLVHIIHSMPWNMHIFILNLMNNQLNIFHHEQYIMGKSEDLVHMILSERR